MIVVGDAVELPFPDATFRCVVTSPPYWGLRQYADDQRLVWTHADGTEWVGGLGTEPTPEMYVAHLVQVFREVRRVLRTDGTCWLNLGDSYAAGGHGGGGSFMEMRGGDGSEGAGAWAHRKAKKGWRRQPPGMKAKDLVGIPWMVAFALRADGWYLRSDLIWAKPNPMPESVQDRPTRAHEYVFLLTKAARYYYDAAAIRTAYVASTLKQFEQGYRGQATKDFAVNGAQNASAVKSRIVARGREEYDGKWAEADPQDASRRLLLNTARKRAAGAPHDTTHGVGANARSVWTITPKPFREAHFATFPPELVERCLKAGSAIGDYVLDPFGGSGTTAVVARALGRVGISVDLSPTYARMASDRLLRGAAPPPDRPPQASSGVGARQPLLGPPSTPDAPATPPVVPRPAPRA